jgi:hypothetical protein
VPLVDRSTTLRRRVRVLLSWRCDRAGAAVWERKEASAGTTPGPRRRGCTKGNLPIVEAAPALVTDPRTWLTVALGARSSAADGAAAPGPSTSRRFGRCARVRSTAGASSGGSGLPDSRRPQQSAAEADLCCVALDWASGLCGFSAHCCPVSWLLTWAGGVRKMCRHRSLLCGVDAHGDGGSVSRPVVRLWLLWPTAVSDEPGEGVDDERV